MIEALISLLVLFIVLAVVFWIAKLIVEYFGMPAVILQVLGLILALVMLLAVLRAVGVVAGGAWRLYP
jgi:hypothetical protein